MRVSDIQLLFDFNYWANQLMLTHAAKLSDEQLVQPASFPYGNLLETLKHILDSEYVWRTICTHNRFMGQLVGREDLGTLAAISNVWQTEEKAMRAFLNSLSDGDLDRVVSYASDDGNGPVRERILWHCLVHVVNHGTQHRTQCAAMLKDMGQPVGSTDFTYFLNLHLHQ
ncbi:MAG: DinB family protein [Deinococcota bacterium]